jgi:DNA-binding MarR family transcriptional regulator
LRGACRKEAFFTDYKACAEKMIDTALSYARKGCFANVGKKYKGEVFMLDFLSLHEPCRPSHIGNALNFGTARIAMALGGLEKKGFIKREMCQDDRRVIQVSLTDMGREHAKNARAEAVRKLERVFAAMGEESVEEFLRSLKKFMDAMFTDDEGG